jgi:hypothetical protein
MLSDIDRILTEHGAVTVADPIFCTWEDGRLNPARPLESIARKIRMIPPLVTWGPAGSRLLARITETARRHRVDGAIHYAHIGCGQSAAMIKPFKDALNDMDIPVLVVDCDITDPTVTTREEIGHKLEQFIELLEED